MSQGTEAEAPDQSDTPFKFELVADESGIVTLSVVKNLPKIMGTLIQLVGIITESLEETPTIAEFLRHMADAAEVVDAKLAEAAKEAEDVIANAAS